MTNVLFQTSYGAFQSRYAWMFPFLVVMGILIVPVGIFWNEGWKLGVRAMEPWSAAVIIEIIAVGALLTGATGWIASAKLRKSPQRVAVTDSTLVVPKGMFSNVELELPLTELNLKVFNVGFVKQLQVKHKRRKILLSSARFPSDADFDALVEHLPL